MCLQPFSIKNPNYGLSNVGLNYLKDCDSQYLSIPCGHCPECIAVKQMYWVQRIKMESLKNYVFFCTLTYDNAHLPSLTTSNGYDIRFADIHDVQLLFKKLRNKKLFPRPFRYLAVSELGKKGGRPHFHILFLLRKWSCDDEHTPFYLENVLFDAVKSQWTRNTGTRKFPVYEPLFKYVRKFVNGELKSTYDLHYVSPRLSVDDCSSVAFYVLKYMMKPSDRAVRLQRALKLNLDSDEYDSVWNLVRPRLICSKGFGFNTFLGLVDDDIVNKLKSDIERSDKSLGYPQFFSPDLTGLRFPLSDYYRRSGLVMSVSDAHDFYFGKKDIDHQVVSRDVKLKKFSDYEKNTVIADRDFTTGVDWL